MNARWRRPLAAAYSGKRTLIGKLVFEIVIIFVGVTAAFALESVRRDREEAAYRSAIIRALIPTLDDMARHNRVFETDVQSRLDAFDTAIASHQQLQLPVYREGGAERPPVRIWDSVVATGAARTLDPSLLFDLSTFYNRQDSFGERYVRYAAYTEQHIFTLGADHKPLYDASGRLRPQFVAYVDRLRELLATSRSLTAQSKRLRTELEARH